MALIAFRDFELTEEETEQIRALDCGNGTIPLLWKSKSATSLLGNRRTDEKERATAYGSRRPCGLFCGD